MCAILITTDGECFSERAVVKVGIKSVKGCSRDIFLKEHNLILSSPGFEEGKNYDINLHCKWNIQSNSAISVDFTFFDLEYQYKCSWDYLMVYDGKCREVTSTKFCGTKAPSTFKGTGSMCIEFKSDQMVTKPGFQVMIKKLFDTSQQQKTDDYYLKSSSTEQFLTEINPNSMFVSTDGGFHTSWRKGYHSSAEISPSLKIDKTRQSAIVEQYYTQTLDTIDTFSPSVMLITIPESQNVVRASVLLSEMHKIDVTNTLHYQYSQIVPTQSLRILATESSSIPPTHLSSIIATLSSDIMSIQLPSILPTQSSYVLWTQSSNMQLTQPSISLAARSSSILLTPSSSILSSQSSSFLSTVEMNFKAFYSYSITYTSTKWETSLPGMSLSSTLLTDIYYGFSDVSQTPGTILVVDQTPIVDTLNDDKKIKQIHNQKKLLITLDNTLSNGMSSTLDYFISKMYNPTQVRSTSSYKLTSVIQDIDKMLVYKTDSVENFDSSGIFYEIETPHMYNSKTPSATKTFKGISETSTYGSISDIYVTSSVSFLPKSSIAYGAASTEVPLTYNLPVACFMTEQVLINGTGSLVVDIKPATGQLECSWLLFGHFDEAIEVNITNFNIYIGVDCDSEGLVINDGFSAQDGVLFKLCNHTSHINLLSSGPALVVEVMTRGHINLTLEYDPKPKGLDCPARLSKCDDRKCLPSDWWCDNEVDCFHGEDEQSCGLCGIDEFRCGNGQCIKDILQCNGRSECDDSSDENDCVKLDDMVLRIRHGRSWLPVCADKWEDAVGHFICKYLSFDDLSGSQTVPSSQTVYMSRKQGQQDGNHVYRYLHPSTICQSKTEIILNCSKKACGERSSSLMVPYIIGGTLAYKGQWPWVVAVRKGNTFICGGTLISDRWVITAGHCVESVLSVPHMVSIVTGTPMKDGRDGNVVRVSEIIINPDYNFIYKADIAVLLLQMPVLFDDYIKPICLPNTLQYLPRDSPCYTAGWGLTDPKGLYILFKVSSDTYTLAARININSEMIQDSKLKKLPNDLMYAKAFMWTNSKCSLAYSSEINDSMICAGILVGKGGDTCQGDSGGPLMCKNNHGTWQLVGVTSWGGGICGKSTLPGVYTRVTKYNTWIKSVTAIRDHYYDTKCDFEKPGICSLEDISTGSLCGQNEKQAGL
ncbi:TMPRSS15 [Mytilus coruscus]|uniref:TMPRSS15 n=1 Tax=Mytilus coruscus TaxID=42192 RepID=A0A6J8EH80_MYTCO|nr:TMPRSS15 [Mytilus coruscus]